MKKKCIIYGNCQAEALKIFLPKQKKFEEEYDIISLKPVHLLDQNDIPIIIDYMKSIDLFIYQNISENYRGMPELGSEYLKNIMKSGAQKISFPSIYFKGFNPELVTLKNIEGGNFISDFAYIDINILNLTIKGANQQEIIRTISKPSFYTSQFVVDNYNSCIDELALREKNCDFSISQYIKEFGQNARTFHVFNHPTAIILDNLSQRIFMKIFDNKVEYDFFKKDVLSQTSYPIYNSVHNALKLKFDNDIKYVLRNQSISQEEYVSTCIKFADLNKEVVEFNIKRYRRFLGGI